MSSTGKWVVTFKKSGIVVEMVGSFYKSWAQLKLQINNGIFFCFIFIFILFKINIVVPVARAESIRNVFDLFSEQFEEDAWETLVSFAA